MSENPLRCPKCHQCNLLKAITGRMKCPSCGYERELQASKSFLPLTDEKNDSEIQKIKIEILNKNFNAILRLIPYLNKNDRIISHSIEHFFSENRKFFRINKDKLLPIFKKLVDDSDESTLIQLLSILKQIGFKELNSHLVLKLHNSSNDLKIAVIKTLGTLGDKNALIPLIEAVYENDKIIKQNAIISLGEIGDKQAVQPLIEIYELSDIQTKLLIIQALEKMGEKKTVIQIAHIFKNFRDPNIQESSANVMKNIRDPNTISQIFEILMENDFLLRDTQSRHLLEMVLLKYGKKIEIPIILKFGTGELDTFSTEYYKGLLHKIDPKKYSNDQIIKQKIMEAYPEEKHYLLRGISPKPKKVPRKERETQGKKH